MSYTWTDNVAAPGTDVDIVGLHDNLMHLKHDNANCVGVVDNIVNGLRVTAGTGLKVNTASGRAIINETVVNYVTGEITLDARMATLIYAKVDGSTGKVNAKLPAVDANTIVRYDFATWDGTSAIPNSAVGVNGNTIAVANALTKAGTVTRVDGHCGYAGQGDGSTGYFVSANSTGFPVGASEREVAFAYTFKQISNQETFFCIGATTTFELTMFAGGEINIQLNAATYNTGFVVEIGKIYKFSLMYDGATVYLVVNGSKVYSLAIALSTTLTVINVLRREAGNGYCFGVLHYLEIRNKMRTPAQIAQIANNLLLPCSHQSGGSIIPQMTSNTSSSVCNVSATNEYSTYLAYKAVDGVLGVNGCTMLGSFNQIWTIDFLGVNKNVKKVTIMPTTGETTRYPKNFAIEGWNGSAWVTVGTYSSVTNWVVSTEKEFILTKPDNYTKYRVNITSNNGDATYTEIGYIQMDAESATADIRSILPVNSIVVGYAKTGSTGVNEIIDSSNPNGDTPDWAYGIRLGANKVNSKKRLIRKYFSGTMTLKWDNPFGNRKLKTYYTWSQDSNGTNESDIQLSSDCVQMQNTTANRIAIQTRTTTGAVNFNGTWLTSGYIQCYAEVIE